MQGERTLSVAAFDPGKVALRNADGIGELLLGELAPLAHDADGVLAVRDAVGNVQWDQDLVAGN